MTNIFNASFERKQLEEIIFRPKHPIIYLADWLTKEMDQKEMIEGVDFEVISESGETKQKIRPLTNY